MEDVSFQCYQKNISFSCYIQSEKRQDNGTSDVLMLFLKFDPTYQAGVSLWSDFFGVYSGGEKKSQICCYDGSVITSKPCIITAILSCFLLLWKLSGFEQRFPK